jgi:hypothetical protein
MRDFVTLPQQPGVHFAASPEIHYAAQGTTLRVNATATM